MKFVKLHYDLMHQKGYTLTEKIVWAYIQGFPKCFASDKNIAGALGMTSGTVRQTLHKIRLKSGLKGRNWTKSITIPCYQAVTDCYHTVTPMLPHGNTQGAKSPMKTAPLLDRVLDNTLDIKEESSLNRVVKQLTPRNLSNPLTILLDAEKEEAEALAAASATVNKFREEYISARRKQA
tara:strand:- start:15 stop:551 length:537 start_codon:yes stop_codon:yes gene_type:complete